MLLPQEQTVFKDRNIKSKQPFPSPTSNTPVSAGRESSIKAKTITKRSYNPFYHSVRKTATVIDFTTSHGGYNLREYCDW
ncbi:uncharacterized protein EAF01_003702 [Botrytis porri]|uniref:uncharacterized protein n=1 Tax=Botrytis porri TaxID=87229 RepID=UPI0019019D36|nr:uncharacterized protein EAF01_003702 [Botrytis porri]KAF7909984.1 hypothetical protein EAF01_003702 [Botrytis porri]